ncbi:LexA-binding, inner membrane-associated putative hydrolase [Modicisalibacter ilicicola DSM 19980]|uniref:LexA-binding, inner membrane-associated putative hydrolase n=1 Tax=Modicisalibacter ilicicola DSM 19980 TaxID=1121942 RepID=A0A1M5DPU9_9GAMM|nr:metal-dependent hydrolase [Halomonas ilicicola]SHF68945.1 LexA-binding, inner membrane-associated putative hydrolase [Halomonas ilicicola DSM 19980]
MADFRTHLGVAAGAGILLALGGWQGSLWSSGAVAPVAVLVAFGGILPDIDSDNSHAIRLIFTLFAILAVAGGALLFQAWLRPGPLLVACGALFLAVRYVLSGVFKRFSVHRGIWHSLLAALLGGMLVTTASYQFFSQAAWLAWVHGLAVVSGATIHLLLDECYSVDLVGARIKRSFGTAFKLFDYRQPFNSLLMLLLTTALTPWLPPWSALAGVLSRGARWWF